MGTIAHDWEYHLYMGRMSLHTHPTYKDLYHTIGGGKSHAGSHNTSALRQDAVWTMGPSFKAKERTLIDKSWSWSLLIAYQIAHKECESALAIIC